MQLLKKKKGSINIQKVIAGVILTIVTFIVTFYIVGSTAGDVSTAAGNISSSGLPLASLFQSNGVVLLIMMAALLISLIGLAFKSMKH